MREDPVKTVVDYQIPRHESCFTQGCDVHGVRGDSRRDTAAEVNVPPWRPTFRLLISTSISNPFSMPWNTGKEHGIDFQEMHPRSRDSGVVLRARMHLDSGRALYRGDRVSHCGCFGRPEVFVLVALRIRRPSFLDLEVDVFCIDGNDFVDSHLAMPQFADYLSVSLWSSPIVDLSVVIGVKLTLAMADHSFLWQSREAVHRSWKAYRCSE